MTPLPGLAGRPLVRIGGGLAVSVAFVLVIVSRVDLAGVGHALLRAAPALLLVCLALAWLEICARAWRWQYLLRPIGRIGYLPSLAYLCVGYFANTFLPVRLGDLARAYLAGSTFGVPRLATLGTIVVERLTDGVTILAIALALGLLVAGGASLAATAVWLTLAALLGGLGLVGAIRVLRSRAVAATQLGRLVNQLLQRLAAGAEAIRRPRGLAVVLAWTLFAYGFAVASLTVVAASVGLDLTPLQAGFVMAGLALSTAIPAAPGSVGTYEFVGLTLLTALGFDPEASLAAVVLLHLAGTIPPAAVGLAMTWHYHVRVESIAEEPSPA